MARLPRHVTESLGAAVAVFRNRDLRRLALALAGSVTGEWASIVALSVFAFEAGGVAAVGLLGLIRMLPAAAAAPFAALLADRFSRTRVMVGADLARAVAVSGASVAFFLDAPAGFVYAAAGLVAVISTAFRPAQAALLPSLARTPDELTAANVVSSTVESVAFFAGPALGGLLLAVTSAGTVFGAQAVAFLWSAALVARISVDRNRERRAAEMGETVLRAVFGGFRAIGGDRRLQLILGLFAAQTLVHGALTVLVVVVALDLLEIGEAGVGLLSSADGLGGLLGAVVAFVLVGRRLAGDFARGLILWGIPIALIGLWPESGVAFVALALVGLANTVVDVAGLTLLQRAVPDEVLARVFGVLETMILAGIALGAVLAPVLVSLLDIRGALVVTGLVLPVLVVLLWRPLAAVDAESVVPTEQVALLRTLPLFGPLPAATLEQLASSLTARTVAAGEVVFSQGDRGDRFYLVAEGEFDVTVDRTGASREGPGGYFGEIALLRDVPRTATVRAHTDGRLYALDRDVFIAAVTGHPESAAAAEAVVAARLRSFRPEIATL